MYIRQVSTCTMFLTMSMISSGGLGRAVVAGPSYWRAPMLFTMSSDSMTPEH